MGGVDMLTGAWKRLGERLGRRLDVLVWSAVRGAVDAVRYQPRHLELVIACGVSQPEVPPRLARWAAELSTRPAGGSLVVSHPLRRAGAWLTRALGPVPSVLVRWFSGALAAAADHAGAAAIEVPLHARAHPGLLVPHPHVVLVVAVDMRGFSSLTAALDDTQYLADLLGEYLRELTEVVEGHRGLVFQYTGDGLLALFLPELTGLSDGQLLDRVMHQLCPALHRAFDGLHERWRSEWQAGGRDGAEIGLGVGLSFGDATIGFLGPSGKKHFGVIGAPVNLAAFLCSEAEAGVTLVDRESFAHAGATPPQARIVRLRSKKLRRRIEALRLRYGPPRPPGWRRPAG